MESTGAPRVCSTAVTCPTNYECTSVTLSTVTQVSYCCPTRGEQHIPLLLRYMVDGNYGFRIYVRPTTTFWKHMWLWQPYQILFQHKHQNLHDFHLQWLWWKFQQLRNTCPMPEFLQFRRVQCRYAIHSRNTNAIHDVEDSTCSVICFQTLSLSSPQFSGLLRNLSHKSIFSI